MKVNVLGTEYTIFTDDADDKELTEKNRMGYCFFDAKEIHIMDLNTSVEWKDESEDVKEHCRKHTLRHELIHAFLAESGLWGSSCSFDGPWAMSEEMVDWMAIQFPKILKAFRECGCI